MVTNVISAELPTPDERLILVDSEKTIKIHLHDFCTVGFVLMQIRDNRLCRSTHPAFEQYCKEEWPGILAWAVEGCLDWQMNGLSAPEEVQAATADYRKKQDDSGDFFENCIILDSNDMVSLKDLYEAYVAFSEANGESPRERLGKKKFNERVTDWALTGIKDPAEWNTG